VYADFKDKVDTGRKGDEDTHLLDIMSPLGTFEGGIRKTPWSSKDIPGLSGKLMPEFDKRRSIKDMFTQPSHKAVESTRHTNGPSDIRTNFQNASATTTECDTGSPSRTENTKASPSKSPALTKRRSSDAIAATSRKKQKQSNSTLPAPSDARGQQSLKGFFMPKSKPAKYCETLSGNNAVEPSKKDGNGVEVHDTAIPSKFVDWKVKSVEDKSSNIDPNDDSVHDPVASKESWSRLLKKPAAPMCEHNEPCKSMLTRKKGENQGRSFWMCQRPLGPSGNKEKGTQWRCSTFIWSSDWKGDG